MTGMTVSHFSALSGPQKQTLNKPKLNPSGPEVNLKWTQI